MTALGEIVSSVFPSPFVIQEVHEGNQNGKVVNPVYSGAIDWARRKRHKLERQRRRDGRRQRRRD